MPKARQGLRSLHRQRYRLGLRRTYALRSANGSALRRRATANAGVRGANFQSEKGDNIGCELTLLADGATEHRRILGEYSPYLLDQMIGVVTASTLISYIFYTISPETVQNFNTEYLALTIPFPLYGIFRYLYLVHQKAGGGSPAEMLLTDRPLLVCVALWAAAVVVIVYGSGEAGSVFGRRY